MEAGAAGVVFADINLSNAQSAVEESKSFASNSAYHGHAISVDVESLESVQEMVKETVSKFGRIDYLVNSAGVSQIIPMPYSLRWSADPIGFVQIDRCQRVYRNSEYISR